MAAGYDVVSFPKNIECAICLDAWLDPTELMPCKHVFCTRCVAQVATCPICRKSIVGHERPNRILLEFAMELTRVKCKLCSWEGNREESLSHGAACKPDPTSAAAPVTDSSPTRHPPGEGAFPWLEYNITQEMYDMVHALFLHFDDSESGGLDANQLTLFLRAIDRCDTPAQAKDFFDRAKGAPESPTVTVHDILRCLTDNQPARPPQPSPQQPRQPQPTSPSSPSGQQTTEPASGSTGAGDQQRQQAQAAERRNRAMTEAERFKTLGNDAFETRNFGGALDQYTQAVRALEAVGAAANPTMREGVMLGVLRSNQSACCIELRRFQEAVALATQAIHFRPTWAKGFMRRAQAFAGALNFTRAREDVNAALQLQPSARDEITAVLRRIEADAGNSAGTPQRGQAQPPGSPGSPGCRDRPPASATAGPASPAGPPATEPSSPARSAAQRAEELVRSGKAADADAEFAAAINLTTDKAELIALHCRRASVLTTTGNHRRALASANAALALDQSSVMALLRRAQAFEGLGQFQSALDDYNQARCEEQASRFLDSIDDGAKRCRSAIRNQ